MYIYICIYYTVFVLIRFHGKISHLLGWNQVVLFLFSATSCDAVKSWTFWTVKKLQLLGFGSPKVAEKTPTLIGQFSEANI